MHYWGTCCWRSKVGDDCSSLPAYSSQWSSNQGLPVLHPCWSTYSSEGVIWMCRASFTWLGFIVEFTHTPSNEVHASGSLFNKPKHAPTPSAISYLCTSHLHAQIVIYILVSQVLCPYGTNCLRTFITVSLFLLLNLLSIMSTILLNMSHIFVSGCTSH